MPPGRFWKDKSIPTYRHMTMKKIALLILAAMASMTVTSCKCCSDKCKKEGTAECCTGADAVSAVEKYLVDEIAPCYTPGEVNIPVTIYSKVDESDTEDVTVLGDFWILNYYQAGDTLKCVSGGNHSGLLHLKKGEDGGYIVTDFEQVADGSDNLPSARRIFGDLFDEYASIHSNQDFRDSIINCAVTDFAIKNALDVNYYQDYGWPAIKINR